LICVRSFAIQFLDTDSVYSGAGYERDKQQALDAGAQGYLVKPVDYDELIEEISRIISEAKRTLR